MSNVSTFNEAELRELVRLDAGVVSAIEEGFRKLATGSVVMPAVMRLDIEEYNGEVDVKSAYLPGVEHLAIKVSSGFFDNQKRGLPSLSGLMILLSAETGLPQALLLDNGYLTDVRTAAAGAVAGNWLSREDSSSAGVIGTGAQASLQLEALLLVRPIERALVWGRDDGKSQRFAERMSERLGIEVSATASREELVRESDIVVTTTPSRETLVLAEWLQPGTHVTAMGSDAEHKNEIDPLALARADRYVCDSLNQCRALGELHHAVKAGAVPENAAFPELGEVIAGSMRGRSSPSEVTIADLTGTGAQDTAIAALAFARAVGSTPVGAGSKGVTPYA